MSQGHDWFKDLRIVYVVSKKSNIVMSMMHSLELEDIFKY